jgi:Carboxypeptidase regulatory-like domain/TonB dependent receptor-like, beta-barrel
MQRHRQWGSRGFKSALLRIGATAIVLALMALAGQAQTFRGAINGTVTDPSGAVVPNAQVKATEASTGLDHTTDTTSDGQYSFQDLPLGFYKVTVTAAGFPPYTIDKVEVVAGTIYTLPIKLSLQQQSTTVEVSAAALSLDTTTQTQNTTITSDVVQNLPLNGRDFTQLIAVAPGYGGYSVGGFGSLNGTRPNQMNWQIDGVDNNDFWHNIPAVNQGGVSGIAGVVLPVDSIDEFSAQTQSSAEAGRNAGGTVNLVIKSGTNQIHGSVYYYNRNEYYGAHSPFFQSSATVPKAPPLRNENYGFSVGGPIIKQKAFYFVSYEKQQYIIGLSGVATDPSDAWVALAQDLLNNPGGKYGTYAPVAASTLSQSLIGPNGFWPRNLIGSLPATPDNFFSPIASTGYSYNGVAKVDYNITDKHRIFVRWFGGQGSQTAPTGGSPALGTASSNLKDYFEVAPIHVFNYSLVLNSTLSSKLTNQVLVGANYFNQVFHDFNNSFNTQAMGLFLSPDATNHGQPILGAPNIIIAPTSGSSGGGFEQVGITPPEGRNDITWHLTDSVSWTTGDHQFRFGGEVRQGRVDEFYHRHGTGTFDFTGAEGPWSSALGCSATTPSAACQALFTNGTLGDAEALADFLAGTVSSSSIAVGNPERHVKVNAFDLFMQDSWQFSKKLTLTYGVRYEYFGPLHSDGKDLAVFTPGSGLQVQGNGISSIFPPDKNNFAPRVGFAYQPLSRGDLVVRGGFGVFYDQINMNPFLDFRPGGSFADGLEDNPFGPSAVSVYTAPTCPTNTDGSYNWQAVQQAVCPNGTTPNAAKSIFPGVQACSTPFCTAVTDPKGLGVFGVSQNFRTPYFYNYSLQVEKSFGNAAVLEIGYVGSEGRKLSMMFSEPTAGTTFGSILSLQSTGTSNYNALQTTFKLRSWHGLTSQYSFTWGHALDEVSEYRAVIADSLDRRVDYGNGDYDTRRLFTASFTYNVPNAAWASDWKKWIFHDWQANSLWNFHTGQPSDEILSGLDVIGNPFAGVSHTFSAANGGEQWWNPAAFAVPAPGTVGNESRNKFYGPGYGAVDLSVSKNIPIGERVKIQLRAEIFNLLNRINLASGPGSVGSSCGALNPTSALLSDRTCTTSSGFGKVSDTIGDFNGAPGIGPGEAFNMQLVAKIIF